MYARALCPKNKNIVPPVKYRTNRRVTLWQDQKHSSRLATLDEHLIHSLKKPSLSSTVGSSLGQRSNTHAKCADDSAMAPDNASAMHLPINIHMSPKPHCTTSPRPIIDDAADGMPFHFLEHRHLPLVPQVKSNSHMLPSSGKQGRIQGGTRGGCAPPMLMIFL
jgi:hypothetical protein